jgi:hypothetical protein
VSAVLIFLMSFKFLVLGRFTGKMAPAAIIMLRVVPIVPPWS